MSRIVEVKTNEDSQLFRVVGNLDVGCQPGALPPLAVPAEDSRLLLQDTALVRTEIFSPTSRTLIVWIFEN